MSTLILSVFVGVGLSFAMAGMAFMKKDRQNFQLLREHRAVTNLVASIPSNVVRGALCGGHPYFKYDPTTKACVPGPVATAPNLNQINAWRALGVAVSDWPTYNQVLNGSINPSLDQDFYTSNIKPKMQSAGCLACHNGAANAAMPADVSGRNFGDYFQLTQLYGNSGAPVGTNPPLATRAINSSRFGQLFMMPSMKFTDVLYRSEGVAHTVKIGAATVAYAATQMLNSNPLPQTVTDTNAFCPATCPPGSGYDMASCVNTNLGCTTSGGGGGKKGKGGSGGGVSTCTYRHDYVCKEIDTTLGSAQSSTDLGGCAAGPCPANQPMVQNCVSNCLAYDQIPQYDGKGNLTGYLQGACNSRQNNWLCFNTQINYGQSIATQSIIVYTVDSTWIDPQTSQVRNLITSGVFQ